MISGISCLPINRQLEERHLPSGQKSFMIDARSSNLFMPKEDKQFCACSVSGLCEQPWLLLPRQLRVGCVGVDASVLTMARTEQRIPNRACGSWDGCGQLPRGPQRKLGTGQQLSVEKIEKSLTLGNF